MFQALKNILFRFLRLVGALAVIYICMVFYLALTERQNAFPRAITHKEANAALQGKAQKISCTLDDGIILSGWQLGNGNSDLLLYFPDTDEDAAQFLAEVETIDSVNLVAFNYRGSGENKGTPSSENFVSDSKQIFQCALQVNGNAPKFMAGRGIGAILAAINSSSTSKLIFIDPIPSIADKVSSKYRMLYPKFIIRADVQMPSDIPTRNIVAIQERKTNELFSTQIISKYKISKSINSAAESLKNKMTLAIQILLEK